MNWSSSCCFLARMLAPGCRITLAGVVAAALIAVAPGAGAHAEDRSPFADFLSLSDQDLAGLQIRITYVGNAPKPLPSLALLCTRTTLDEEGFGVFRRPEFLDANRHTGLFTVPVEVKELRALLDSVAALPLVIDGGVDSLPVFSFALLAGPPGAKKAFESILNGEEAFWAFEQMRAALSANARAAMLVATLACALSARPGEPASEVTRWTAVTMDKVWEDPRTGRTYCWARVHNRSSDTLEAPLVLVLDTIPRVAHLLNEDGYTCRVFSAGAPFVLLPVEGSLAPGASVSRLLEFDNPGHASFQILKRTFIGMADR